MALLISLSAFLGAIFLPETCPKIENGLTVAQRLLRFAEKHARKLRINEGTVYSRVAQTAEPARIHELLENETIELQSTRTSLESTEGDLDKETKNVISITYTKKIVLQILSVSLLAFHKVSSDVLVPIFLASPAARPGNRTPFPGILGNLNGGFGLSTVYIGYFLLVQAAVATVAQILLVPRVIARVGVLKCYRRILLPFPLLYALIPFTVALPRILALLSLMLILAIWVILVAIGYTCCSVL